MNTKPLTQSEIEELRKLEAKATPGEWISSAGVVHAVSAQCVCDCRVDEVASEDGPNAALIAAMRNALPRLLSMLPSPQLAQPGENCCDPTAPVVACCICGQPVHTCEADNASGDRNHACPAHPNGSERESGVWVCSERCDEVAAAIELLRGEGFDDDADVVAKFITAQTTRLTEVEARYNDLLMSVARKHDGENRHETAKRYIVEAESRALCCSARDAADAELAEMLARTAAQTKE